MKTIEEQIKDARCATPDLPLHRAQLRRALLSSQKFEGSSLYTMKRLLPSTALLLLILGLSFAFHPENTGHPLTTPTASAQEVLANAAETFQSLTDAEIAILNEKFGVDSADILTEAHEASDLHLAHVETTFENGMTSYSFPEDTFSSDGEMSFTMSISGESQNNLTFLEYTKADGSIVRLGVDPEKGYAPSLIFVNSPDEMSVTMGGLTEGQEDIIMVNGEAGGNMTFQNGPVSGEIPAEYNPMDGEITVDENGCTHWTSDDGMMGGGGC